MLEGVRRHAPACLPWADKARQLQARMNFLHRLSPHDWPDVSDARLMSSLEDWLLPYRKAMFAWWEHHHREESSLLSPVLSDEQARVELLFDSYVKAGDRWPDQEFNRNKKQLLEGSG